MRTEDCREALATLGPPWYPQEITALEGGWSYWTFRADDHIVRFPRSANDALLLEREFALLPIIRDRIGVPTPRYTVRGEWRGRPFGAYPHLPGRSVSAADLAVPAAKLPAALGSALRALHETPLAALTHVDTSPDGWWQRKRAFLDECRARAFPLLPAHVQAVAAREIEHAEQRFRDGAVQPALAHNDLGLVHVLTDGHKLTGIIDWSDAEVTDPVIDFVGIVGAGGSQAVAAVLGGYGMPPGEAFWERLWFLAWVAPLHDILYGLDTGDDDVLHAGIAGVETRMRSSGRLL